MALTKITSDVIGSGAVESTHIASGAISSSHLTGITTDNVSEGSSNTYFTNARARGAVSVTGGNLSYDSGTGVIQLTTGTIRAQLSAGTGVTYNSTSGAISIGQSVATDATPTFGNTTLTGYLRGPATFTIDPATHGDDTGTVVIAGNLQVDGTTTTINSTTLTVDDKLVTLASGSANAGAANGAGIEVDISGATNPSILYDGTDDEWDFNKGINVDSNTLVVDASNNRVGIGTDSPGYDFEVRTNDTSTEPQQVIRQIGAGDSALGFQIPSANNWYIGVDNDDSDKFKIGSGLVVGTTPHLNIDTSGNVGIGTTSPQNPLEIQTTNKLGAAFTGGTDGEGIRITQTDYTAGNNISLIEASYDDASSTPDARIGVMFTGSGSTLKFGTSNNYGTGITNTAMAINPDGKVGINETSPDCKLHIKEGTKDNTVLKLENYLATANGATYLNWQELLFEAGGSGPYAGIRQYANGWQNSDAALAFWTQQHGGSYAERMRIDGDGKVLVGDTASHTDDLLQIETPASGGGHGIQIRRNDSNTDQGIGRIMFGNNTDTDLASIYVKTDGSTDNAAMTFNTQPNGGALTERMRIDSSGKIGINTSDPSYFLDIYGPSDTQLRIDAASGNAGLFYAVAGTNKWEVYHRNPDNTFRIYNYTTSQPEFIIDGATGHIGIGTVTPQNQFEVWNDDNNAFVSVGVKQHAVSSYQGIHFGYAESGNSVYRKSAIVFERTDLTENNAQGKVHILNGPQTGSGSATLSDRKITIMENGNVEAPFIRAGAWSGEAMHTNGTDALEIGVSGGIGYVHGYDRTNSHYIELAYDGTTHRFATSGGFSNVHIDGNGNMAVNTGENSNTAANTTNSLMDGIAHTGTVLSNNGPVVMGRSDGSNSGETGAQYSPSNEPRCIRNWFTYAGPSSNAYSSPYVHMKTNLWAGGSPSGNTEFTMSCFTFYDYYGYGSNYSCYGTSGWHNWSGSYYNLMLRNYGNWDIAYNPYTSSDGYVVIVARIPNAYSQFSVDWAQWGGYSWRERKVTNVAQHNAATGKY